MSRRCSTLRLFAAIHPLWFVLLLPFLMIGLILVLVIKLALVVCLVLAYLWAKSIENHTRRSVEKQNRPRHRR